MVQPNIVQRIGNRIADYKVEAITVGVAFGLGAVALFGHFDSDPTDRAPASISQLSATEAIALHAPLSAQTDESLSKGGYNCGHVIDSGDAKTFDYTPQINYLHSNPELAKNVIDFQVRDAHWGVGEKAWDFLMENGLLNENTKSGDLKLDNLSDDDNDRLNAYVHRANVLELDEARNYHNFTCVNKDGKFAPIHFVGNITIQKGDEGKRNHVIGVPIPTDKVDEFVDLARKDNDGNVTVDLIHVGKREVKVDGKTKEIDITEVVTEAKGCNNGIRKFAPPKEEKTPTTPTTPTTPPSTPPTTAQEAKLDEGELPPADRNVPAEQDHGTADVPGDGPAGQTPDSSGYVAGEEHPATSSSTSSSTSTSTTSTSTPGQTTPTTGAPQEQAPPKPVTTTTTPPNDTTPTTEKP